MQDVTYFRTVLLWNLQLTSPQIVIEAQYKSHKYSHACKCIFNNNIMFLTTEEGVSKEKPWVIASNLIIRFLFAFSGSK